jgi:hypothetical protein
VFLIRSERARTVVIGLFYGFHVMVFGALTIAFWPHLVAMAAFLPLERVRPVARLRRRLGRPEPEPATA